MMHKERIVELKDQLAAAKDFRKRVDLLNQLAWELRVSDLPGALAYAEQARELAIQGETNQRLYQKGLADSLHNLSRLQATLGEYEEALSLAWQALALYQAIKDLRGQGMAHNAIGLICSYLGNFPDALTALLESLQIFEKAENQEWQASLLNNLGYLHLSIDEPRQALDYLQNGLSLTKGESDQKLRGDLLDNASKAYCMLAEYENALACGLESLACYRNAGVRQGEAQALNSIGDVYQAQSEYEKALASHQEALEISRQMGLKFEIVEALLRMGSIYGQIEQLELGLEYLRQALDLALEIDTRPKVFECHQALAKIYKQRGDFKAALEHFERYQALERQVFNERADNRLKALQVLNRLRDTQTEAEISELRNIELRREIELREKLIAELNAFAHTVAHDLRSPLSSILMSTSMILDGRSQLLNSDDAEYLRIAKSMAERMDRIIKELLILASVRQQDVTLIVVDMSHIIANTLEVLALQIEQENAQITYPDSWPKVFGYPAWIEEVWTNYISNALKYGGRPPVLELGYEEQDDGYVRFWVRDNGDGIPLEEQSQLFTSFTQLGKVQTRGYGLGLSIVQRIVKKLGGQVSMQSEGLPGKGSIFSFTLPGQIKL